MGVGPQADFTLDPNTKNPFALVMEDANGSPIDYTGSTFLLEVKARDANDAPTGSVLLSLETGSGIEGDVEDGEIEIEFPLYVASPLAGLPAGSYIYTCLRLESGIAVEPAFWGFIDVEAGVAAV